jgi:TonB family protein
MTGTLMWLLHFSQSFHGSSGYVLALLFEASLKGTVFLLLAGACTLVLRRASAAARHLVWSAALGMMLALPIASLTVPAWNLAVIPSPEAGRQLMDEGELAAVSSSHQVRPDRGVRPTASRLETPVKLAWPDWLLALYVTGLMLAAARIVVGEVRVRALSKRSRLFETVQARLILEQARRRLRMSRTAELRTSAEVAIPFTRGVFHPTILLPEKFREWPAKQLEFVLVHELGHVSRHDCLTQMIGRFACVLYWFHPLVWFVAFQMRNERERACDDIVLSIGHPATDYAELLIALGRRLRQPNRACQTSVAIVHCSQLEARMKALLNPKLNHRPLALRGVLLATGLAVALLLPAAAIHAKTKNVAGSLEETPTPEADNGANRTASMSGTLRDPSGAAIPGAEVSVLNVKTRHRITIQTRSDGTWELPSLPAGRYRVEITKPGFTPSELEGSLRSSRTTHWDVIMQIGQVTQMVLVRGHKAAETGPAGPKSSAPKRIRVGGDIEAAHAIYLPQPVYPASAEKQGIEGTVVLQAVIGKDGNILSLTPLSGPHQALIQAAMNAARQWRYKPTLLNGAPVEVATTIEVVFQLDKQSASAQETSLPRAVVRTQTEQNVPPQNTSSAEPTGVEAPRQSKRKIVEAVRFRGNQRIPSSVLAARIFTHPSDAYTVSGIGRDVAALWKTDTSMIFGLQHKTEATAKLSPFTSSKRG